MKELVVKSIVSIKNGSLQGKKKILLPFSIFSIDLLKLLYNDGYIEKYSLILNKYIVVYLGRDSSILFGGIKIISKPSYFKYLKIKDINRISLKRGTIIFSTSLGLCNLEGCKAAGVGGIPLFLIC